MRYTMLLAMFIVAIVTPVPEPSSARPRAVPRCFGNIATISDCITSPAFDNFWASNGGLPVFGYPITPERSERNPDLGRNFATQWFERNRFEAHPENQVPYNVLLGHLGAELLTKQGRGIEEYPNALPPTGRCRTFAVAGKNQPVCDPFLRFWETNGLEFDGRAGKSYEESLALFGLPLTFVKSERNPNGDTVPTQWFERARFEDHGAKGVLLGLLGRETLAPTTPGGVVHPIVDHTGFLLGGSRDTVWLDAAETARQMRGGEAYRLYTLDGYVGPTGGAAPRSDGPGPCEDLFLVDLVTKPDIEDYVAVGGDWKARPRASVAVSTQTGVYRTAIRDLLRANGIAQPDVRLTQIVRVDLEGDGVDDVLISATRLVDSARSPQVVAGDYSLLVLRKLIAGKVETIIVEADYYLMDNTFTAPQEYTVANILDLNGDGRMEIVVDSSYYEGIATLAYTVTNCEVRVVVGAGCGN